jgi:hypothetical protein
VYARFRELSIIKEYDTRSFSNAKSFDLGETGTAGLGWVHILGLLFNLSARSQPTHHGLGSA